MVEFRLDDVLEELAGMTLAAADTKGIELVFSFAPGVPTSVCSVATTAGASKTWRRRDEHSPR